MTWDVDDLLAVARLGGHIGDKVWNNPNEMEIIRRDTEYKLEQGWIPDLEYGKWIKPEKQNEAA